MKSANFPTVLARFGIFVSGHSLDFSCSSVAAGCSARLRCESFETDSDAMVLKSHRSCQRLHMSVADLGFNRSATQHDEPVDLVVTTLVPEGVPQ